MARPSKCAVCNGSGKCRACGGTGLKSKHCRTCNWGKCPRCKGSGLDPVR